MFLGCKFHRSSYHALHVLVTKRPYYRLSRNYPSVFQILLSAKIVEQKKNNNFIHRKNKTIMKLFNVNSNYIRSSYNLVNTY